MEQSSSSTCQELQEELRNLQKRFGIFALTKNFSFSEDLLEESEELCMRLRAFKGKLAPREVQRLLENLEKQYEDAKKMALEFSPDAEIPLKELVMKKILELGWEKLSEITKFGKPTLLMTPPTTMKEKYYALHRKNRYPMQAYTYFAENTDDELWDPKPETLTISIVDGLPILPQLPDEILKDENGKLTRWEYRYRTMYEKFQSKGLRMITAHEYAVLMQLSLKNFKKAKKDLQHPNHKSPYEEIVDFSTRERWVMTVFYQLENKVRHLQKIPSGFFSDGFCRANFLWSQLGFEELAFRARAAVEVFCF